MSAGKVLDLGYKPRKWQGDCHRKRKRFNVLALHRRAGKTQLALVELVDGALRSTKDLPLYLYLAPYLSQCRAIAWARLKAYLEPLRQAGAVEIREGDLLVRFLRNGAVIRLAGADNPDALRGLRLDGVVVDEVAQVKPEVWTDILQPALSDRLGWATFIGTPSGINLFSELFYGAQDRPDWHAARYTVYDTGALDAAEIERLRDPLVMPENSFAREYLCDFAAAGDDQLLSLTQVEDAARRGYKPFEFQNLPLIVGVDPARFGDDRSVIIRRQGLQAFEPEAWRGLDNMDLAARLASRINEWKPDAVFVDAGGGAGVIDRLRQLGHRGIIEVNFGGKAIMDHEFVNRRTEMWCDMAKWVANGGALPDSMLLRQELATPTYRFDPKGRKALESKDEIKRRLQGGASPDIADALALTFAAPVVKAGHNPMRAVVPTPGARNPVLDYEAQWRGRR